MTNTPRRQLFSFASFTSSTSFSSSNDSVSFDFDEHFGRNQLAHFHHASGGANLAEKFSMGAADLFPFGNVGHVDARAHDVAQGRAGFCPRGFDVVDGLDGLRAGVAHADNPSVRDRKSVVQ